VAEEILKLAEELHEVLKEFKYKMVNEVFAKSTR